MDLTAGAAACVEAVGDLAAGDTTLHGDLSSIKLLRSPGGAWSLIDWNDAGTGPADHEFISLFMHQFRGQDD